MTIKELYKIFKDCPNISTDTRNIKKNSIFFALKGEIFDGNSFAQEALIKGAKFAIIDNPLYNIPSDDRLILVSDALTTLQKLAIYHREQLNIDIIAVTGSNGKTTVKELLSNILSQKYKTLYTKGNLNNHIGVPLSILEITDVHEIAVIEIGANHANEHTFLCNIAKPTYAIVTNCGKDHLEGFGSVEGVINANSEVFNYMKSVNGTCFVNNDDQVLLSASQKNNRILFGTSYELNDNLYLSGNIISKFPFLKVKLNKNKSIDIPDNFILESHLFGSFHLYNILAATSIGLYFNVELTKIKNAIEEYIPKNNRSQLIEWNGNKLLLDAYNANPSSMIPMINDFAELNISNKMIILGDMFELGKESYKEHKSVIEVLLSKNFYKIILVGSEFAQHKHLLDCLHFNNYLELKEWLKTNNPKDLFILVKGSRGMKLEKAFE
jgi:UDP-N-acetylmuramoyl-tripeptide--D-alanyl-D-alanine ligase